MKKVLLLNPPYKETIIRDNYCCFTSKSGYLWPPIDLLYLSGILRHKEINLKVIDAVAEKKGWKKVLKEARDCQPSIVICLTGAVSYKEDLQGLRKIKRTIPKVKTYILGNAPANKPEFFFKKYKFVDGIIHNFFDHRIFNYLINNQECKSVSLRQKNGRIKFGLINFLPSGSTVIGLKPPQYRLFPLAKYSSPTFKHRPAVTAMTTFGCPFNCRFCVAGRLNYYQRDIKELKQEMEEIKKNGIKEIFFEDSTFNANSQYLKKFCQLLIKRRYRFSWSTNVHSFNMNKDNLSLMKKAGCHTLQIGIESGNEQTLKKYAPSKTIPNIRKAFQTARKYKFRTLGYLIIGFPDENTVKAQQTIDFAKKINPDLASFSILTPDLGTELYDDLFKKGDFNTKNIFAYDSSGRAALDNKGFSKREQEVMIKKAYQEFYLRPRKIIDFLRDYENTLLYLKNGLYLIKKKIAS